jgi:hypothetical protein
MGRIFGEVDTVKVGEEEQGWDKAEAIELFTAERRERELRRALVSATAQEGPYVVPRFCCIVPTCPGRYCVKEPIELLTGGALELGLGTPSLNHHIDFTATISHCIELICEMLCPQYGQTDAVPTSRCPELVRCWWLAALGCVKPCPANRSREILRESRQCLSIARLLYGRLWFGR